MCAHEQLCLLLTDPLPEVRASAVLALGNLMETRGGGGSERQRVALNIGNTLVAVAIDASGLVRREMVIAFSKLMLAHYREMAIVASGGQPPAQEEYDASEATLHTPLMGQHGQRRRSTADDDSARSGAAQSQSQPQPQRPVASLFGGDHNLNPNTAADTGQLGKTGSGGGSSSGGGGRGGRSSSTDRPRGLPPRARAPSASSASTGESSSTYDNARDFTKFVAGGGGGGNAPPPSEASTRRGSVDPSYQPGSAHRHSNSMQQQQQQQPQLQTPGGPNSRVREPPGPDAYPTLVNVWFLMQALCEDPNPRVANAARFARSYHTSTAAGTAPSEEVLHSHSRPGHPLHPHLLAWSSLHFSTRLSVTPDVDQTDPVAVQREWRGGRQRDIRDRAKVVQVCVWRRREG
jgi:hypothetical protein